ncbi:alkaline phosphatase [uncultured Sphingomonas sp.]|uniref:alkaline phosphatase n=1 Tax=uncultured Sphingomonas sp. TaxID=158754 RepID=UPI0035CC32AD
MIRTILAVPLAMAAPLAAQRTPAPPPPAVTTDAYRGAAAATVERMAREWPIERRARNVIVFVGDGMGVSTQTAARIHQGQRAGVDGESYVTAMDRLPHAALVRTYSHDTQVADSAPTATAILAGVKTRNDVIGIGPEVAIGDCAGSRAHGVESLFGIAQRLGRATGIVSTARITHATPAAAYAHTPQRDWEADANLDERSRREGCVDIARQLVEGSVGSRLDVVLGGGRANFFPAATADPEYPELRGRRTDGRDLAAEWRRRHPDGSYIQDSRGFAALKPTGPVLGLFDPDHMKYEADRARDPAGEPSLADMTAVAIKRLSARKGGFVLLVEGGRIDHAHHAGNARRALEEAVALDEAVARAAAATDPRETLILVTADHSHTLSISGYPARGNPILGVAADATGKPILAADGKAYTTLGYANGSGATGAVRADPTSADPTGLDFRQQALVPLGSETHGGEDVAVRSSGPMAHLFRGTIEQHVIFHIVKHALTR